MQDALGTWHDYVVLTESIMKRSARQMLAHHDVPLQVEVLQLATHVLSIAQKELEKFNRHWRDKGDALMNAVRNAFPLTRDVTDEVVTHPTQSQTDRGPADSGASQAPGEASPDVEPNA